MSIVKVLPDLRASGGAQMALDVGLLETAEAVVARRYLWAPPALSLGKFQRIESAVPTPFTVVRRPSGGRAVMHGEGFEWSFAVVFPSGSLGDDVRADIDVSRPYDLVAGAFAATFEELGVTLDDERTIPYQRSTLCFATALRQDLMARGEKIVAIAQARHEGCALVHGSVLERRPPQELVRAAEVLLGEPWQGEGLAGAGVTLAPEMIWNRVLERLEIALQPSAAK